MNHQTFPDGNKKLANCYLAQAILLDGVPCWRFSEAINIDPQLEGLGLKTTVVDGAKITLRNRLECSLAVVESANQVPCVVAFNITASEQQITSFAVVCHRDRVPPDDLTSELLDGGVVQWHSHIPGTARVDFIVFDGTPYMLKRPGTDSPCTS